jgi:broad-specificity NMP kinase
MDSFQNGSQRTSFRWFDLVVALTCDNTIIYDRLAARGYSANKIQENVECEIMQVVVEEARESYQPEILVILTSNNLDDMEENVERIESWVQEFEKSN